MLHEFFWAYPAVNRVEQRSWPQVLRDGDDVGTGIAQILQGIQDLLLGFAHAQNQVRFGNQTVIMGLADNIQRTVIPECWTDALEDAWNGFQVVREDLRLSLKDFL